MGLAAKLTRWADRILVAGAQHREQEQPRPRQRPQSEFDSRPGGGEQEARGEPDDVGMCLEFTCLIEMTSEFSCVRLDVFHAVCRLGTVAIY